MINVIEIEGMNDLIQAIENGGGGGGGTDVPEPTSADRGKFLGVKSNADEFEYKDVSEVPDSTGATNGDVLTKTASGIGWYPAAKELPTYTAAEDGKVLGVDSNGDLEWATPSGGGGLTTTTKVNFSNTTKRVDVTSAGLTNLAYEKTYIPYACFSIEYKDSDSGSTEFKDVYMPIPAYLNKISNAVFVNFAHGQTNWANYLKNIGAIPSDATNIDVSGTVWVSYTA